MAIDNAEISLTKAIALYPNDTYYRSLSKLYISKFNALVAQDSISDEALKPELQQAVANAETTGRQAIKIDSKNYLNWLSLAEVYEAFVPVGINGAYENSASSFAQAIELSPKNPSIYISMANLELHKKNETKAKEYVDKSLSIKPNYGVGYILLAKYQENIGNFASAQSYYRLAVETDPSSSDGYFRLGYFLYSRGNFADAVGPLERAVILDPSNMQYRYYLALGYSKSGKTQQAISQLEYLQQLNPGSKEIQAALSAVKSGTSTEPAPAPLKEEPPKKK